MNGDKLRVKKIIDKATVVESTRSKPFVKIESEADFLFIVNYIERLEAINEKRRVIVKRAEREDSLGAAMSRYQSLRKP